MAASGDRFPHPPWTQPATAAPVEGLKLLNSLTSKLEAFHPGQGNQVGFYVCGPTVYDSAHLGHARAYVTFDIVRRILQDYFNYGMFFVMNITDIDDKIILKARRNHLMHGYAQQVKQGAVPGDQFERDVKTAMQAFVAKQDGKVSKAQAEQAAEANSKKKEELSMQVALELKKLQEAKAIQTKVDGLLAGAGAAFAVVQEINRTEEEQRSVLLSIFGSDEEESKSSDSLPRLDQMTPQFLNPLTLHVARDPMAEWLDSLHGATVTDQEISNKHARAFEAEFLKDMKDLGVREPDVLTRVTEYVPEIVKFVESIIAQGLAYESGGSVYFDTAAYSKTHSYGKLAPWSVGNAALNEEGEGALSGGRDGEKKSGSDFALWKKSKAGEPFWPSPWGQGRPGWHIECSAMASDLLGQSLDIHAGGEDLRFPHHDNEIAQCEAFHGSQQWVNYFLHAGHLHIEGLKMSKSLKNFITIREMLKRFTARTIRILFLQQSWHAKMNFSEQGLHEASVKENSLKEFFLNLKTAMRTQPPISQVDQKWNASDRDLHKQVIGTQDVVHRSLLNNLDYPKAMEVIFELVKSTNKYMLDPSRKVLLMQKVGSYLSRMLRVFGVLDEESMGFPVGGGQDLEASLTPILDVFTAFRSQIRQAARDKAPYDAVLQECDRVRDDALPVCGVRLEDKAGAPSVWKLDDPAVLMRERDEKRKAAEESRVKKLTSQLKARQADVQKIKDARVPARELFVNQRDKYSQFDGDGIPTHDHEGKELNSKNSKFVKSVFDKQVQLIAWLAEEEAKNPAFEADKTAEVARLEAEFLKK